MTIKKEDIEIKIFIQNYLKIFSFIFFQLIIQSYLIF